MPRKPRFYLPGVPAHIVQRGHSRELVLKEKITWPIWVGCKKHQRVIIVRYMLMCSWPITYTKKGSDPNASKLRELSIIVGCAVRTKIPASRNFYGAHSAPYTGKHS